MDEKILGFLGERFGRGVGADTQLSELVQDSISKIELLFEIEQMAGVKLRDGDLLDAETVGEIASLLKGKIK